MPAERALTKNPAQYKLSVEQMVDNDYPVPSYLADVFEKPPGWVETPQQPDADDSTIPRIYAIDCEMVICSSLHKSHGPDIPNSA